MTEYDHRLPGGPLVVWRGQRASERRVDAQHLEEIAGDQCATHQPTVHAAVDAAQHGDGIREDSGLTAQRLVLGPGERHPHVPGAGVWRPPHREQLAGIPDGIDPEEEGVVEGEDDSDQPQSERHRRDNGESGQGARRKVRKA